MNDEQLAADIRRAFGRFHAEPRPIESPVGAPSPSAPVLAPARTPLLARRRLLGGISFAGIAVAAVLAVALTLGVAPGSSQPQSAYAGWQAIPTKNDPAMRAVARTSCLDSWIKDANLLVQDQRGRVAMFVFVANEQYMSCVLLPDGRGGYRAERAGVDNGTSSSLVAHFGWILSSGPASDLPPEVTVFGTTDASRVIVRRADGTQIEASVAGGVFLAWWPGCQQVSSVVAFDASGIEMASRPMIPGDTSLTCRTEAPPRTVAG